MKAAGGLGQARLDHRVAAGADLDAGGGELGRHQPSVSEQTLGQRQRASSAAIARQSA